jgi:hypothetical protein
MYRASKLQAAEMTFPRGIVERARTVRIGNINIGED